MKFSNIRLSAFIATSVDGFIARHNGKLDWLEIASNKNSPDDFGYHDYIGSVDCVVMGRNSFEKAVSFPEWPYHNKRVIVLSRRWKYIPDQFAHLAEHYSGKVELLTVELFNLGSADVSQIPSPSVSQLLPSTSSEVFLLLSAPCVCNKEKK